MHAIRQEIIPPSGVSHAISLNLIPPRPAVGQAAKARETEGERVVSQLVVARSSLLRVFDVVEEPLSGSVEEREREGGGHGGKDDRGNGMEGVKVEEVDGEGELNGETDRDPQTSPQTRSRTRLHLVREHRLHGHVTGLAKIRTVSSADDGLDRLLVSFKDAKIALLEWTDPISDLSTVSLHTYERSFQVQNAQPYEHRPLLRADPESRCAVLLLPKDALAVLPFVQRSTLDTAAPEQPSSTQLQTQQQAQQQAQQPQPYAPSYVLSLSEAEDPIRHIIDLTFLPSFHTPTLAVLHSPQQTWTGRLSHARDTCTLSVLTLDVVGRGWSVIMRTQALPYDAFSLLPARGSSTFGGVVVLCSNSILHVDPAGRVVGLASSGWHSKSSALKLPLWPFTGEESEAEERRLEGARACWAGEQQLLLVGAQGWVREIRVELEGRNVSALRAGRRLGRTAAPAVVCPVSPAAPSKEGKNPKQPQEKPSELLLVGSEAAQSVLLRLTHGNPPPPPPPPAPHSKTEAEEEKEIEGEDMSIDSSSSHAPDELEDIYGDSALPTSSGPGGADPGSSGPALPWLELEVQDALEGHGPIADLAFALSMRNGQERASPMLVCSTPQGGRGGWTVYENGLPVRVKRKIPAVAGTRGVWSVRVRREREKERRGKGGRRSGARKGERDGDGDGDGVDGREGEEGMDTLLVSSDATPSPGISRTITITPSGDLSIISRLPTLTIACGAFFSHTALLQITTSTLRLLDADGKEVQILKDTEGNKDGSLITRAWIEDPWVVVMREDGSVGMYLGEGGRRRVRGKALPQGREKTPTYAAAFLYTDHKGLMLLPTSLPEPAEPHGRKRRASSLEAVAVEDALKEEDEHLSISIEPEAKRRRLRSSDEKDKEKEKDREGHEKNEKESSRSGRHSTREREREREKEKEKEKEKERSRREEKSTRERESSRRHRESDESFKRHRDSKDAKDGKEGKGGKENGSSSRSSRHRDTAEKEKDGKERERSSRRRESDRRKSAEEEGPSQWLLLYNTNGRLEIWSLPKMHLVFSTRLLSECRAVLDDAAAAMENEELMEETSNATPLQVEDVILCPIGDDCTKLYLLVYYTEGRLAIYEAAPSATEDTSTNFPYRFIKVLTHFADAEQHASIRQMLPEARRLQLPTRRALIPFTSEAKGGISAVFQRGEEPCWIMASRLTGLRIIPYSSPLVYSFTPTSVFGSKSEFILYGEEGPVLMGFDDEPDTSRELTCTRVTSRRPYTSMAVDPGTNLVAAASSLKSPFLLYDDEEQPLWLPESAAFFGPMAESSSLELVSPDTWQTIDGYDFSANEFINTVKSVTLETPSSESGFKDYIAVGTSTFRGEDLAVRGATYIFEIIEVVSYPDDPLPPYRLKLLCRDEAKAPVNAICGMNGYLVSSQGFKVFVRAFEGDERLVGVGFMDAGVCVTSLTCLKNLLLVGDAKRSVSFVAFQEDPFKLVPLARDHFPAHVVDAAFLFDEGDFGILAADDEGNLRMFEYDPALAGATHGNPLLCATEFNGQSEHTHLLAIAGRGREDPEEVPIPEAQLVFGTLEGSLGTISPVPDDTFKRLQLLSGQLMRSVQHFAGLNPRAFRTVRNDHLSRPLNKGILDNDLLRAFQELNIHRQATITKQIGTDTITVLRDIRSLQQVW